MTPHLRLRVDGAVATLLLDRPDKRNAINLEMWAALPGLVTTVESDPAVRALVITSATPGLFSAGADIAEFPALRSSVEAGRHYSATIRAGQVAVAGSVLPVIAAISGPCLGGGCGLALACDLRIADASARLGSPAARLGVIYSLPSTKRLMDVVGAPWAKQLLLTGDPVDAATALRIGLVNEVTPPEELAARAWAIATRFAAGVPHSVRSSKRFVNQVLSGQVADDERCQALYDASYVADAYQAGVDGFLTKASRSGRPGQP